MARIRKVRSIASERHWGEVGEGGAFYQWYVPHECIDEAKQVKKGVRYHLPAIHTMHILRWRQEISK